MCGIVGIAGDIGIDEEKMFIELLYLDTRRGPDSTGIVRVSRADQDVAVRKELGTPWDFWADDPTYSFIKNGFPSCLIGHNRWATVGKINQESAHPFSHGNIHGVHNGTLYDQTLLDDFEKFEVDSDNIIYQLNKTGVEDTALKLDGAFALVWWDEEKGTINFFRNKERPLKMAYKEGGNTVLWASEGGMLEYAADRLGYKLGKVCYFETNKHYWYEVQKGYAEEGKVRKYIPSADLLGDLQSKEIEVYQPPKKNAWFRDYWGNGLDDDYAQQKSGNVKKKKTVADKTTFSMSGTVGKYIYYKVIGNGMQNKDEYVLGVTTDDTLVCEAGIPIRVYVNKDLTNYDDLGITGFTYRGVVKKITRGKDGSSHLVVDRNTVKVTDLQDEEVLPIRTDHLDDWLDESGRTELDQDFPEIFIPVENSVVTLKDFERLVSDGCAICTDPIDESESEDLIWIHDQRPVCWDCQYHGRADAYFEDN